MRSYHANLGAGIDGLSVREHEIPEPGPTDVLVRVRAVSLSFRELMILRGWYPLPVKPDVVPVSDGAGEVVAVGERVCRVVAGDRVTASIFPRWIDGGFAIERADQLGGSLDGMLTEYALLDEDALLHVPEHLSYQDAACLPCAGVTAWNALAGGRGLRPGDTVLTLGSGGVSLFALQLAKAFGARVIATTSSPEKAAHLRRLGADEVINYREMPDWHARVLELTDGRGVEQVVDVSGIGEQSIRSVAVAGEIAFVGLLSGEAAAQPIDPRLLFVSGAVVRTVAVGSRTQFAAMNRAIADRLLRPVINRMFTFDAAVEAYRYYAEEQPLGKVVITQP
jgi:NADPH:quinone reductase-like Zn-dependent oxidoreductase